MAAPNCRRSPRDSHTPAASAPRMVPTRSAHAVGQAEAPPRRRRRSRERGASVRRDRGRRRLRRAIGRVRSAPVTTRRPGPHRSRTRPVRPRAPAPTSGLCVDRHCSGRSTRSPAARRALQGRPVERNRLATGGGRGAGSGGGGPPPASGPGRRRRPDPGRAPRRRSRPRPPMPTDRRPLPASAAPASRRPPGRGVELGGPLAVMEVGDGVHAEALDHLHRGVAQRACSAESWTSTTSPRSRGQGRRPRRHGGYDGATLPDGVLGMASTITTPAQTLVGGERLADEVLKFPRRDGGTGCRAGRRRPGPRRHARRRLRRPRSRPPRDAPRRTASISAGRPGSR